MVLGTRSLLAPSGATNRRPSRHCRTFMGGTKMQPQAPLGRRDFLKLSGLAALASGIEPLSHAAAAVTAAPQSHSDYALRIGKARVDLGPDHTISTTTYNGQFPGPLLRLTEGRRVVVDIFNDTDVPEQLHWHGQNLPADVDGAAEEGTPYIPAHGNATHCVHSRTGGTALLSFASARRRQSRGGAVQRSSRSRVY